MYISIYACMCDWYGTNPTGSSTWDVLDLKDVDIQVDMANVAPNGKWFTKR